MTTYFGTARDLDSSVARALVIKRRLGMVPVQYHPKAAVLRLSHSPNLAHLAGNPQFDALVSAFRTVMKISASDPPTPNNQFNPLVAYLKTAECGAT